MVSVFWDTKGVILIDFLDRGLTVNSNQNQETLTKFRCDLKIKRSSKLSESIILHHDN